MGLEETRAWVRVQETGKARRNRRYRERAAAQGQRPFSTLVPDETRETVRLICRQLCDGELNLEDLTAALQRTDEQHARTPCAPESLTHETAARENKAIKTQILMLAGASSAAFVAGIALALTWG